MDGMNVGFKKKLKNYNYGKHERTTPRRRPRSRKN
jgi:hypothetical protein